MILAVVARCRATAQPFLNGFRFIILRREVGSRTGPVERSGRLNCHLCHPDSARDFLELSKLMNYSSALQQCGNVAAITAAPAICNKMSAVNAGASLPALNYRHIPVIFH